MVNQRNVSFFFFNQFTVGTRFCFFIIVIIQYRVMFLDIVIIKGAFRRIRLTMFLSLVSSLDINLNRREEIAHRIVSVKLLECSYVLGCAVSVIVKLFCTFEAHQFFSGKRNFPKDSFTSKGSPPINFDYWNLSQNQLKYSYYTLYKLLWTMNIIFSNNIASVQFSHYFTAWSSTQ